MARRRREASILDDLFAILIQTRFWLGPIIAAGVFAAVRWAIPWALSAALRDSNVGRSMASTLSGIAVIVSPIFGAVVLLVWGFAEIKKRGNRNRLERQAGSETINNLSWAEFEALLSEAFRRQGFAVKHCGGSSPDGGIDIRLDKAGARTLVQCKHWQQRQVGVKVVRELLGVVVSEGAQSGIVVTSGRFTPDAIEFASKNTIRLIDGQELIAMLGKVQNSGRIQNAAPVTASQVAIPAIRDANDVKCPQCGAAMVRRVAKTGQYAGSPFLGCSRFPACRGKRNLTVGT